MNTKKKCKEKRKLGSLRNVFFRNFGKKWPLIIVTLSSQNRWHCVWQNMQFHHVKLVILFTKYNMQYVTWLAASFSFRISRHTNLLYLDLHFAENFIETFAETRMKFPPINLLKETILYWDFLMIGKCMCISVYLPYYFNATARPSKWSLFTLYHPITCCNLVYDFVVY